MFHQYARFMDRISVFLGHACGAFYFACIAISGAEVILRYVFNAPTVWSTELTMILCASAWILSVGFVTERRRHISITMLEMIVSPRVWRYLRLFQILFAIGAVSVLAWAAWTPAMKVLKRIEYSGTALNSIEPSYFKFMLLVGCVLYILQLVANLVRWVDRSERETSNGH